MENNSSMQNFKDSSTKKVAFGIYISYLVSLMLPIFLLVGVIFAYIFEKDAETTLISHYQFLIRSFWIGLLYFLVASLSIFLMIGIVLFPLCVIWWLIRIIKGIKSLSQDKPILNPKTWLF